MSVKSYQKIIPVQAIEFQGYPPSDPNHINDVMTFVQVPVSLEFTASGIQLRVILNPLSVLVVPVGGYVVKDIAGKLSYMKKEAFEAEYTLKD